MAKFKLHFISLIGTWKMTSRKVQRPVHYQPEVRMRVKQCYWSIKSLWFLVTSVIVIVIFKMFDIDNMLLKIIICVIEQRQNKNGAIWSKSELIFKLPPISIAHIGEWKSAANSKLICHSTKWSRSYIVLTLALLKDRFRLRNDLPILVSHFYPLRDERKGLYLFNILELLRHNFAIMEKLQDQSSVTYYACVCKIVFLAKCTV